MPTPQQYAGQTGVVRPMNGAVPGLTWDSFMSAINNGPNIAANYSQPAGAYTMGEGGGFSGGIMPRAYDVNGLGTVGVIANGGQDAYTQDVGDGTTNWFTRNPDGTVGSQNRTQNNDSWWDSTGTPMLASLGFGAATAGIAAAGVGVSGAGAGAVNVGAGALGADGASAAFGGGASGVAAGGALPGYTAPVDNLGYATPEAGGNLVNISADAATTGAQEAPSWLQQAQSYYAGLDPLTKFGVGTLGSTITSGLAGNGGGDNSFSSLINGYGGETSGIDYSSLGSSDSSGNWLTSLLNGAKTGYNAVKDFTGLNGNQLLGGAATLANGIYGSNAASNAASQQTNAINQANALTAQIYGDSVNRNKPFLDAGTQALGQQTNLLGLNGGAAQNAAFGQFQASPGYQWRFDQGVKGVQSSAAASGGLFSGRAAKDLTSFGQGQASQEYDNYSKQLNNLLNVGQNSANLTAQLGNSYGNTAAALTTAGGIAQSAGTMGGANAWTNALTQLLKQQQSNGYYGTVT